MTVRVLIAGFRVLPIIQVLDGDTLSPPVEGIQPVVLPSDGDWAELVSSLDTLKTQVAEQWQARKAGATPNRAQRRAKANGKVTT